MQSVANCLDCNKMLLTGHFEMPVLRAGFRGCGNQRACKRVGNLYIAALLGKALHIRFDGIYS